MIDFILTLPLSKLSAYILSLFPGNAGVKEHLVRRDGREE